MNEWISVGISTVALLLSLLAFLDSRRQTLLAARLARQPALVFFRERLGEPLRLNNIGNGAALDVVVAQQPSGSAQWDEPLRMPELSAGGSWIVPGGWISSEQNLVLAARYVSVTDERYVTTHRDSHSRIAEGWGSLPGWGPTNIQPHGNFRQ